jgi:hypothetical protein
MLGASQTACCGGVSENGHDAVDSSGTVVETAVLLKRTQPEKLFNDRELVAGRLGVIARAFRNLNKEGRFQHNWHDVSELALSDSFVGSRLLASVFGFCQCNDTRNDTRPERLPSSSRRKRTRVSFVTALR